MNSFSLVALMGATDSHSHDPSASPPDSDALSPSHFLNSSSESRHGAQDGYDDAAQNADNMLAAAAEIPATAAEDSTAPPATAAAKSPCCTFYCANEKCRRQVQTHPRGIVCTACMSADKWRRCSSEGCTAVVHAICAEDLNAWKCPSCSTKPSEHVPSVPASTPMGDCDECLIFEADGDMYTFLRDQGYRINNSQKSGKTWECSYCNKTFYAKKMKDNRWSCPITIVHDEICSRPVKPVVKDEHDEASNKKGSIRYFHEFGKYSGLLDYIEILGCTGEIRTDQMQRAIRLKFNVHVSSGLLYRTAKNAHDEMFGSNISDVEELLKMSEEVGDEGGFLKLFTGDISVYTAYETCQRLCNAFVDDSSV
jgi:hypothetical protein